MFRIFHINILFIFINDQHDFEIDKREESPNRKQQRKSLDFSVSFSNQLEQQISNSMLDWCRNQQILQGKNQLTLIAETDPNKIYTTQIIPPLMIVPKIINQTKRLHGEAKKGIKTHFNHSSKVSRETQTVIDEVKYKGSNEIGVQTQLEDFHLLNPRKNSLMSSKNHSPKSQLSNTHIYSKKVQQYLPTNTDINIQKTKDIRNENYWSTKTSCLMNQLSNHPYKIFQQPAYKINNVESYHIQNPTYLNADSKNHQPSSRCQTLLNSRLPTRFSHFQDKMVQSIRKTVYEQQPQQSFSQKYKNVLKNVESQFKLSEKKISYKQLKYTPEKRILFHDRQTIVSKYGGDQFQQQKSMRVEESLVYDRQTRSLFTPIGKIQSLDGCILFLACEGIAHFMVSIKEISVQYMDTICEQLLIYRQLQEQSLKLSAILELYQTQINRDTYIFIKQPFTESLVSIIKRVHDLSFVQKQISQILYLIRSHGFTLKVLPQLNDFVVCYEEIKIQNLGIFEFQKQERITVVEAISKLKEEILETIL